MSSAQRAAWAASLLLAACGTADPVVVDHGFDMPERWAAQNDEGQAAASQATLGAWWTEFDDPALTAAVIEGLAHNHDLQATAARLEAAAAQAVIAGADLLPSASAGFNGVRNRVNFIGLPIPGATGGVFSNTINTFGVSLDLSWELDLWGRVRSGRAAALADWEAAAGDFAAARLSLVGQLTKAWFASLEAEQQVELADATVASFASTRDDVRDFYESGTREALDLRLAELNVASAQANRAARGEQLARARRQLEILLGRYPKGLVRPAGAFPSPTQTVPAGVPSEILRRRPDLRAAERRLAAAGARVDEAVAALYPRLSLTASGGTSSNELEDVLDTDFRVWSLAGNLLAPLFEGGRLRANVDRTDAQMREAAATYSAAVLRALSEVEIALAVERDLARQVETQSHAAEHAEEAAALARERYERGLVDFLFVADTQRQALQQQSLLITAQRQAVDARIDLYLALGGGFEQAPAAETTQPETERP